jgi:CSLREA domain-containing protein
VIVSAVLAVWAAIAPSWAGTLVVTTLADTADGTCDADCSLREAIAGAASGDTITFANSATGMITLVLGDLVIDKILTLAGPGQSMLTISGGDAQRIFDITPAGTLVASSLTFAHGKAEYYPPLLAEAGGVAVSSGAFAFTDCTFSDNHADGRPSDQIVNDAGVLYSDGSNKVISFTRCTFVDNTAGGGACLDIDHGTLTITDSTFTNNTGSLGPACVIGNSDAPLTISGTTFNGNTARAGGALFISGSGLATIKNTTIYGNTSLTGLGAGVYVFGATSAVLSNLTLSGNVGISGANLYVGSGSQVAVRNSIVADTSSNCAGPGTITSHGYNLDSGGSCNLHAAGDLSNTPAKLAPLGESGGKTRTMPLAWASAAIDAGNPAASGSGGDACEANDQRGILRPQFSRCDIGAFETTGPETIGDSGFHTANDDSLYSWPPQDGVTQFETRRSGTPTFAPPCVGITTTGASWSDPETPLPGAAFFYINRPLAPQLGVWGWTSAGNARTTACP